MIDVSLKWYGIYLREVNVHRSIVAGSDRRNEQIIEIMKKIESF